LDALNPTVIADLIRRTILTCRDEDAWKQAVKHEQEQIKDLKAAARHWRMHVIPSLKNL
jgi:hypothetical protein